MKYGLIGEHLTHSYSCEIHAQIADYEYELHELRPDELGEFMTKREFNAINVTIPYKQDVIPYLDEISETAKRIGAVNTIVNRNGKLYGDNTDFPGMLALDWILNVPQYRMQGNAEMDKLDLLGGPTIENGTLRYKLSDMLRYIEAGADVVLDEGNTIKPECADVLHSLTDEARRIQVPGYGLVKMHPKSSFTITMNEGYAGTNYMNEATIDRFTPIQMSEHESVKEILRRVVPTASEHCLNVCDVVYCAIKSRIDSAGGLEPDAMTIRGLVDALRAEPLLGLRWGLMDNVAAKPQDQYTRLQLTELIESMVP